MEKCFDIKRLKMSEFIISSASASVSVGVANNVLPRRFECTCSFADTGAGTDTETGTETGMLAHLFLVKLSFEQRDSEAWSQTSDVGGLKIEAAEDFKFEL